MEELFLAGFSLIAKIGEMIASARQASAEKSAAIAAAFQAAESALDQAMTDARTRVAAEELATEKVISDTENTKPGG